MYVTDRVLTTKNNAELSRGNAEAKYREGALNEDIFIMPLVIQQWVVLVVMFVLVIAVVSWSATHLGKRSSSKAENISRGSGNILSFEPTINLERELQFIDSIDVSSTSEKSTTIETSGTAANLETLEDSSTLGTLEKSSTLVEKEFFEVTDASSTEKNVEVPEISEDFTFSTTECPDIEDYKQDKVTTSTLNTPQDIQEFPTGHFTM